MWKVDGVLGGPPEAIRSLGRSSQHQTPEARDLGTESPALGDFCNFLIKMTHFFAYFGQNSYF